MRFFGLLPFHAAAAFLKEEDGRESLAVGGQALLEGVMMRNGDRLALAVRKTDGTIVSHTLPWSVLFRGGVVKKPWLRGFPVLLETMVNGIKALNLSADIAAESEGEAIKPWQMALTLAVAIGLALLLFVVTPHLLTVLLGSFSLAGGMEGLSFHVWDGLLKFGMFVGYIALISRMPDIRRVFEYHGAEHKTIAAYEDGEDPVNVESAGRHSRLHPRCGTTFLLFVLSLSILLHAVFVPIFLLVWNPENAVIRHGVVLVFKLLLMVPISAAAYELIRMAAKLSGSLGTALRAPGLLLQRLTTREPDASQLEVGLVALSEALGEDAGAAVVPPAFTRLERS